MQCGLVARKQTYESEVCVLFLDVPEGFFYNYQHLYLSLFNPSLLSYIWKLTRKTRNYFRGRLSPPILGCILTLEESSTSSFSTFKSWNVIPVWILFIQLYPHRITVPVNRYPTPWLDIQYLWRYLAKIQKIPNFPHAILLLHRQFGQNQWINKPIRLQMRFS